MHHDASFCDATDGPTDLFGMMMNSDGLSHGKDGQTEDEGDHDTVTDGLHLRTRDLGLSVSQVAGASDQVNW